MDWLALNLNALDAAGGVRPRPITGAPRVTWHASPPGIAAALATRSGASVQLHSRRDPLAEARGWLESVTPGAPPPLLGVIGIGLGFLLDVIEPFPDTRVLAIEPLPEAVDALLARRDWRGWLQSGRLVILSGPAYEGASRAWRLVDARAPDPPLLLHPVLAREYPDEVREARDCWRETLFGARANADARDRNAGLYLRNTLANLPQAVEEADSGALDGLFDGIPGVLVAAGPSLDRTIGQVASVRGHAVVVAVDTAVRPLLTHGIEPHVVVSLDPTPENARHLHGLGPLPDTWLVAEPSTDPRSWAAFEGRTFGFSLGADPWPWLNACGIERPSLRAWGSVVSSAFDLLLRMGCSPIGFAGCDFAFAGGRPYCRGTTYEEDWAHDVAAGESVESVWARWIDRWLTRREIAADGAPVPTAPHLIAFRNWVRDQACAMIGSRRFVNAGAGLLHGPGIELAVARTRAPARGLACTRPR
jgi:hypothetical protein